MGKEFKLSPLQRVYKYYIVSVDCILIYIYIYILPSTDTCFTVPQLISVAWYNLDMAWQPFIPKRLSVTIAVMCTSRECKANGARALKLPQG